MGSETGSSLYNLFSHFHHFTAERHSGSKLKYVRETVTLFGVSDLKNPYSETCRNLRSG
jgi:hypothetical protein